MTAGELAEQYALEDERQAREDIVAVLATAAGRRLLMRMIDRTGVYRPMRLEVLAYDAGRRDSGLDLLARANEAAREQVALAAEEQARLAALRNAAMAAAEAEEGR